MNCRAACGLVVYSTVKKNQTIYRLCRIDVVTSPQSKVFLFHDLVSPARLALGSTNQISLLEPLSLFNVTQSSRKFMMNSNFIKLVLRLVLILTVSLCS
ncbi:hypothetical protein GEMRC1_013386 [Eukaryota sp. GEM-RC1]